MKEDLLQPGREVKLTLKSGKEFEGRVISRSGIGYTNNYAPIQEVIKVENTEGSLEISVSQVRNVFLK